VRHIHKKPEPPYFLTSLTVVTYKDLEKSEEGKKALRNFILAVVNC
jgi:hypothetical protein